MDFNPVILSIPLYFLLIGLELLHQLVTKRNVYRTNDAVANIGCGILSQITNAVWGVLSVGMYQFVYQFWSVGKIPDNWWTWMLLFVLVDLCYYWFHRASHEVNFLWNTSHVVHHQSEDYNLSVALRQSSFGGVFSMLFYLPLAFMGFSAYAFLTVKGINLIYQFWIHTEAINKLPRWFEYVFNTPSHHRVHHGRNPKYIDRNHAGTLMVWDRMFGTFQAEEEKPTYGVTKPTNTWNPVWANILPISDMTKQVLSTPGFVNKMKVLFYKPGWRPESQGGYQSAPEVDKSNYHKYNTKPTQPIIRYIFVQFVLVLGFTALFLFTQGNYDFNERLGLVAYITWSIAQLGLLLENRRSWVIVEYIRLLASGGVILFVFGGMVSSVVAGISFILFSLWLSRVSNKVNTPSGSG